MLCCRYVLMQSSSGVTSEIAVTGKATQACITEVSRTELLINQDTSSLFLGTIVLVTGSCHLVTTSLFEHSKSKAAQLSYHAIYEMPNTKGVTL